LFEEPEMRKISPDYLATGKVKFSTRYGKELTQFSGKITGKAIVGTFDNKFPMKLYGYKIIQLRRISASQKKVGGCR